MATRRKYKIPHFRDGGRVVMQDERIADDEPAEAGGFPAGILGDAPQSATAPLDLPAEVNPAHSQTSEPAADENPLQKALDAQRRADELQREAAQREAPQQPLPSALEQHIQKIPNLSEHKRAFLRQFPVLIEDPVVQQIFNRHYVEALQNGGFTDDTAALDNHLIAATAREIEQRRQQLEPEHVAVRRLDDEAEAIMRSEQPPAPIAPPPVRRATFSAPARGVPMSAPVSRDAPMVSGDRRQENTLRADEREIARVSRPDLPPAQAEYEYLLNKRKMIRMKANGEIQGDR